MALLGWTERSSARHAASEGGEWENQMERLTWEEICRRDDFRGRWIALDGCRYDEAGRATEGSVVDVDDDLAELCQRLRESQWKNCAILFCDADAPAPPAPKDPFRNHAH